MDWESVLQDVINTGTIRELFLKRIPVLKTCDDWKRVEPVGWVEHKTNLVFYKGAIVKLRGNMYFVSDKTFDALSEFINFRFNKRIQVIMD